MTSISPASESNSTALYYPTEPVRDAANYEIFSNGDLGAAHVMAHRLVDENKYVLGHKMLGQWLSSHTGSGSDWVHLHFHMAIFELAVGEWDAAYERYRRHILPVAQNTHDALTDAPALLWRLKLSAAKDIELSWDAVRNTALQSMKYPLDPFTELHNLLALAGAGDLANLDRWIRAHPRDGATRRMSLVRGMADALKAYVTKQYYVASGMFANLIPELNQVGGSGAQNLLFEQILLSSRLH